jgi:hypothetical protein
MEGINTDVSAKNLLTPSSTGIKPDKSLISEEQALDGLSDPVSSRLTDLQNLLVDVHNSSPDIRPEALTLAKSLINSPNWLNDDNLDLLAGKISDLEI